jgi:hypothetical protein
MKITDSKIVDWLEANMRNILVHSKQPHYLSFAAMQIGTPSQFTYQRVVRKGMAGQNIYSEKEYTSLREMAGDAIKEEKRQNKHASPIS